jgi:teichuronic acid biosynthesis glycosyltransferase TuaC
MKVLVFSLNFPNAKAPIQGVFVKERVRYLAKYCEVKVVSPIPWFPFLKLLKQHTPEAVPKFERIDGLDIYHPRFFYIPGILKSLDGAFLFLSSLPIAARLRHSFRFDLIDAHFAYPDGFAAVLLGKIFRVPVAVTLRGTIVSLSKFFWRRQLIRWTLRHASQLFSVATFLKNVAVGLGIQANRINVIPNGVDSEKFYAVDRKLARDRLKLPLDARIIISIGSLIEHKGHHRIISILSELIKNERNLIYLIVGGPSIAGDYSEQLKYEARSRSLDKHVLFVGDQPHDELKYWLSASDLFCLATKSEGWANVLLEAMACGLPVVTTDVGGNKEIITSEEFGFLVQFGDSNGLKEAILKALRMNWDKQKIIDYARRHSWDRVAGKIYDHLSSSTTGGINWRY